MGPVCTLAIGMKERLPAQKMDWRFGSGDYFTVEFSGQENTVAPDDRRTSATTRQRRLPSDVLRR